MSSPRDGPSFHRGPKLQLPFGSPPAPLMTHLMVPFPYLLWVPAAAPVSRLHLPPGPWPWSRPSAPKAGSQPGHQHILKTVTVTMPSLLKTTGGFLFCSISTWTLPVTLQPEDSFASHLKGSRLCMCCSFCGEFQLPQPPGPASPGELIPGAPDCSYLPPQAVSSWRGLSPLLPRLPTGSQVCAVGGSTRICGPAVERIPAVE